MIKYNEEDILKFLNDEDNYTEGELGNVCIDVQSFKNYLKSLHPAEATIPVFDSAKMWRLIESANWTSDHDYERIREFYKKILSPEQRLELGDFFDIKEKELHNKYKKYWLGDPGIDVSDDGWSDLKAEVIGRGENFYNSITVEKLVEMADNGDYEESFLYAFGD